MPPVFIRSVALVLVLTLVGPGCTAVSNDSDRPLDNSTEEFATGPNSQLEGNTVRILPYGATYEIPKKWLEPKPKNNFFLTREDITDLKKTNGFDHLIGEAKTMDSVLPLEFCVAHLGDHRWNSGVVSDQVRVYITDTTIEDVARLIQNDAIEAARRTFDRASLTSYAGDPWQKFTIEYFSAPTHSILYREIDFYLSRHGEKTVMFVFLHSVGGDQYVKPILSSFRWVEAPVEKTVANGDIH